MTERHKIEEYLRHYAIEECLDETINELIEKRPVNPYVAIARMMEVKTLAEIMDLSIHPTIVGRGLAGVEAIVTTNIGPFVGASAYRYDSPEIGHNEMSPDYSQIQEAIKLILCKIDPRDVTSIDKALEDIPNIDPAVSLAVSLACYRAAARHKGLPLYRLLAEHSGEENMRMPLPVVSILSRARGEEGALLSTQDLNILPTSLSNVFSIIEALQCLHRSLIQAIDKEKIPLTVSDSGSIRVVMPSLDDAVKFLVAKVHDSGVRGHLKIGIDLRAIDFIKDAPDPTSGKRLYNFRSAASVTAAVAAPAPAPAPAAKGKKGAAAAAPAAAVVDPATVGESADDVINSLLALWKDTDFVSVEDPIHPEDAASLTGLAEKLGAIVADVQKDMSDKLAYCIKGVGGEESCRLQVVADVSCRSAEDVRDMASEGSAYNAVKIRMDKFPTVSKALQMCEASREAGWALVVGCNENGPETMDTFIADLAVAVGAGQFSAGGIAAGEHFCKYSRLLEIAREDPSIRFVGKKFRKP